jgi:AraC-like DNA-binding protein
LVTSLVKETWTSKEDLEIGSLRYLTVRLLHELMNMPAESEPDTYFTRSQIAIVKEAEALILSNLTRRITAKELAERFGVSESSFKFYVKGILGDSYLNYFRKKRMEKAAELLESTTMKIIEVANAVGYENQDKFAKVFAETYGVSPLEFRRLSK